MQVRSGVMGKMECIIVIELQGYLALHQGVRPQSLLLI